MMILLSTWHYNCKESAKNHYIHQTVTEQIASTKDADPTVNLPTLPQIVSNFFLFFEGDSALDTALQVQEIN